MQGARPVVVCLLAALALSGCPDKKPEPEPVKAATPVAAAPKPPPPPPEAPVDRAVKECGAPIDLLPATDVKVGDRAGKSTGYKLSFD